MATAPVLGDFLCFARAEAVMNQIVPHLLWVGHSGEARDFRKVFGAGIKAVVDVALEEPPTQPPRELVYCRFPLLDGADNDPNLLRLAIATLAELLRERLPTLVCCANGMSRSPALAAAALAHLGQGSPEECLERVLNHHPSDVVPGLWNEVHRALDGKGARGI
jgi:hypothetical protein